LLFGVGGLTGLFLSTISVDRHLHDTYFIVAHFHFVMVGGTLTALLGGLYHWWPKITGRMYSETIGRLAAFLVFAGFNMTFLPQFVMGSRGMMRRYARYDPEFQIFHQWSTVGAYVLGAGVVLAYVGLLMAIRWGKPVAGNPFGAASLEWQSSSPPSFHNFDHKVVVNDPYDFATQEYDEELDSYVHRRFLEPVPSEPVKQPQPH
jgi:cytochrome c oxidase subunit 1